MDVAPVISLDLGRRTAPAALQPNLSGLTRAELAAALVESGAVAPDKAKMRAAQLWRWIHHHGVTDFAADEQRVQGAAGRAGRTLHPGAAARSSSARSAATARASG